jgi:predicted HAD superfamily Cof-like phosphohydrolase
MKSTTEEIAVLVKEFHEGFFLPVVPWPNAQNSVALLRAELIREEFKEYNAAGADRVQRIDALGDLSYVVVGACLSLGISVHPYSTQLPLPSSSNVWLGLAGEVARVLIELNKSTLCHTGLTRDLNNLLQHIDDAARIQGFELLEAVKIIHRSNMTKHWTAAQIDSIPAGHTAKIYKDNKYVVRREDGKVIKPKTFKAPDLSQL